MNTFTPAQPGRRSSSGSSLRVLARAADEEGEIAVHVVMGAGDLVRERRGAGGQGIGVRHLEHRRDPAHDRAQRAGNEIFLMREAGVAEMHLAVDHAGQHVQPPAIHGLRGRRPGQVADGGDRGRPAMARSRTPSPS